MNNIYAIRLTLGNELNIYKEIENERDLKNAIRLIKTYMPEELKEKNNDND